MAVIDMVEDCGDFHIRFRVNGSVWLGFFDRFCDDEVDTDGTLPPELLRAKTTVFQALLKREAPF